MARILLVDDEAILLRMFEAALQVDDHEVTTASDGNRALALLSAGAFDLVVTDLMLPDMEGLGIITEIRGKKPDLPIIAMSGGGGDSSGDYLEMAAQLGAKRTLLKPFSARQLLGAVSEVLRT